MHEPRPPSRPHGAHRRRAAVGQHGTPVQARSGLAAARVAHRHPVRRGRRRAANRDPVPGPRSVEPGGAGLGGGRVRRDGPAAEHGYHPDQCQPCGAPHRHRPRAGRDHRRRMAPQRGAAGCVGRIRRLARRGRTDRRGRRRRCEPGWRRHGPGLGPALGDLHRRPDTAAARTRPDRGHRGAVPGRGPGHGAVQRADRGYSTRARGHRQPAGRGRTDRGRNPAPVHPVRLRAESAPGRDRRGVPQHRAAHRRGGGRRGLR